MADVPGDFRGWLLAATDRENLLRQFPPRYDKIVADHVTFVPKRAALPDIHSARVFGIADDGRGVQALVVEIDGTTDRPDGSTYHMTWSLDSAAGRTAHESNTVIRDHGWRAIEPVTINLHPTG